MILGNSNGDAEKERSLLETMLEKGVEGLLIEPARNPRTNPGTYIYHRLRSLPVPVVLMNCIIDGLRVSTVTPADLDGGRLATDYLLQKGHRRIAMVYKSETIPGLLRYAGYKYALAAYGVEPLPEYAIGACDQADASQKRSRAHRRSFFSTRSSADRPWRRGESRSFPAEWSVSRWLLRKPDDGSCTCAAGHSTVLQVTFRSPW